VTQSINNLKEEGEVTVNGLPWKARSSDDTVTFRIDEQVRVVGIEGVKLIVSKAEDLETNTAD
jgi:membrane protein implicated in regulation of membrane protease activity